MTRWGMALDLQRCVGCYACSMACKTENGTPDGVWYAPVFEKEVGKYPNTKRMFIPTLCMHCEDAPCLKACPAKAITKRTDGIVVVDQDHCIGTRACVAACPYGAMNYVHEVQSAFGGELIQLEKKSFISTAGTVQKCTFCSHRIDAGKFEPACVEVCPTKARIFGDLEDPGSEISRVIRDRNGSPARPEAGTGPSVFYLR